MTVIAIDVRMLGHSGIGTYVTSLVPRIVAARKDWRFCLLGSRDAMRSLGWDRLPNVEMVDFSSGIYSLAEQVQWVRGVSRGADLVWSPHYNIPFVSRGKLMVTVHDVAHLAMPQFFRGLHKRLYAWTMFAAVRTRADRVLCVSRFTGDELARLVGIGNERIEIVHNGIDEGWFQLESGNPPRPGPYLLYVGNVKPHKNLGILLKAFRLLLDRIPHDLVIAGETEGFITGDNEAMGVAAEFPDRIVVTGRVPNDELRRLVANAQALVLPSLYEGFGLPALEAMACGCPVLVSTAASLPEVCGDAAVYFDPRDERNVAEQILSVIENDELRENLRERGRRHASEFSWDKAAGKTLTVIDELVGT